MSSVGTLRDFQTLGCQDQLKCALGARVYLDLECAICKVDDPMPTGLASFVLNKIKLEHGCRLGRNEPIFTASMRSVGHINIQNKRVTNLEKFYDSDLNLIYLQGKRTDSIVTFVPVLSSQPLNFIEIEKIQEKLSTSASKSCNITLAICDTSSNILYYQLTTGVVNKE